MAGSNQQSRPVGETLPLEQQIYRLKVVRVFLREGVPMSKLAGMRDLLEENALRLTTPSHMSEYIDVVLKEEQGMVAGELHGRHVSVIFDGSTRLGEVINIILRFVDDDWNIVQRLVRL